VSIVTVTIPFPLLQVYAPVEVSQAVPPPEQVHEVVSLTANELQRFATYGESLDAAKTTPLVEEHEAPLGLSAPVQSV
jgi:hypothetical protein